MFTLANVLLETSTTEQGETCIGAKSGRELPRLYYELTLMHVRSAVSVRRRFLEFCWPHLPT